MREGEVIMLRAVKNDLRNRTVSLLKNDRAALKKDKDCNNKPQNINKPQINNVISITPFLKRDAGFGGFTA